METAWAPIDPKLFKMASKQKRLKEPKSFKEKLKKVEHNKRLDINDFESIEDMTEMIDYYNQLKTDKKMAWADSEIHEITKFLINMQGKKHIFMGNSVKLSDLQQEEKPVKL